MEFTQFVTPTILTIAISAIVGLIVKAVRLQEKVDKQAEEITELTKATAEQKGRLEAHTTNQEIHFNQRLANEVERRQSDRMQRIESDVHEIKTIVKEIAGR